MEPDLPFAIVPVRMEVYRVSSMGFYRAPRGVGSYDVGISYHRSDFEEAALSLHENKEEGGYSKINVHLNKEGKCRYKIFFRNNTSVRTEILVFVSHYEVFGDYLGTPPQPYVVYPDESVYVGRPNSSEAPYLFDANYMWRENCVATLNSHIVIWVYPEKEDTVWHHRFGFVRSGMRYTYKLKLAPHLDLKNEGYFTKSCQSGLYSKLHM